MRLCPMSGFWLIGNIKVIDTVAGEFNRLSCKENGESLRLIFSVQCSACVAAIVASVSD